VRRSSCTTASNEEASLAGGVTKWPRHSHPGPACAH
jgi:hypothetical protein